MTSGWDQFFPAEDSDSDAVATTHSAVPTQPSEAVAPTIPVTGVPVAPTMPIATAAPNEDEPWSVPNLAAYGAAAGIPEGAYNRTAPAAPRKRSGGLLVAAAVLGALVLGTTAVLGVHAYTSHTNQLESQPATSQPNGLGNSNGLGTVPNQGNGNGSGTTPNQGNGNGFDPNANGFGFDPDHDHQGLGNGSSSTATQATSAQQVGVVDINTTLGFEGGAAAGTGMILTPNGEVLTNNHVIKGATTISVTVVSTGQTYTAKVLGYSKTDDVALLQMQGASNLATVTTSTNVPGVGTKVVGVGNAGGVGGTPSAASGSVTALDQDVTATDAGGGDPETVTGMIQTNAPIQSGDSGGPLMTTDNVVVGMDTAAGNSNGPEGFAIPIGHALTIARQIESGRSSSTVHIGETAFLGVSLQDNSGAQVVNVVSGTAAANAGLTVGSTITSFNGRAITKSSDLITAVSGVRVGQKVTVTWTDSSGGTHSATVTLTAGPAQ